MLNLVKVPNFDGKFRQEAVIIITMTKWAITENADNLAIGLDRLKEEGSIATNSKQ